MRLPNTARRAALFGLPPACGSSAVFLLLLAAVAARPWARGGEEPPPAGQATQPSSAISQQGPEKRTIRGRVVWLADALERCYGITSVPEGRERALALVTDDRQIVVIVEDSAGVAFRSDPRLRDQPVELLVRAYRGSPAVQVIRLFALRADGKYELDYWCATCAIPLLNLRPCSCCQGPVELRARRVEAAAPDSGR